MSQESATRRLFAASATLAAAVAAHPAAAPAAIPTDFQLGFDGLHTPATFPSTAGPQHEGRFAASAPFCASGSAVDTEHRAGPPPAALRTFTCGDGSGSIAVHVANLPGEHKLAGTGRWRIVAGTGEYAGLRGRGSWTTASVAGDPADVASVAFHTDLQGVAGYDAVAPRLRIARVRVRRRARTYVLRTALRTRDDERANAVSYRLTVRGGGRRLASKRGRTMRRGSVTLRLRAGRRVRTIRLAVTASDPLGNERRATRVLRLRR